MNINVSVSGIDDVVRRLDRLANAQLTTDLGNITEAYARKMANESAGMAPLDSGALKNSIASSPQKVDELTWEYGSNLPYATRQEYEHSTHSAFIRNAVWNNEEAYAKAIKKRINRG